MGPTAGGAGQQPALTHITVKATTGWGKNAAGKGTVCLGGSQALRAQTSLTAIQTFKNWCSRIFGKKATFTKVIVIVIDPKSSKARSIYVKTNDLAIRLFKGSRKDPSNAQFTRTDYSTLSYKLNNSFTENSNKELLIKNGKEPNDLLDTLIDALQGKEPSDDPAILQASKNLLDTLINALPSNFAPELRMTLINYTPDFNKAQEKLKSCQATFDIYYMRQLDYDYNQTPTTSEHGEAYNTANSNLKTAKNELTTQLQTAQQYLTDLKALMDSSTDPNVQKVLQQFFP